MRTILDIPVEETVPDAGRVLAAQGIPDSPATRAKYRRLLDQANASFRDLARPRGVLMEISPAEFTRVYDGEGHNEASTPLQQVYVASHTLALFTVTVGGELSAEISDLFARNDFALGSALDAAASEGAELAAAHAERSFIRLLDGEGRLDSGDGLLRFSPGYCGWHISGQRTLFAALRPEEIGITLTPQFLMNPLKSVSGVIVAGPKGIFAFEPDFAFCTKCETHSCRDRVKTASAYR